MGILDALSGGLTTATNAATAQQQGQLQGGQLAMALAMRQAEMQKQRAETEAALANARHLMNQDDPDLRGRVAGAVASATGELPKNTAEATHLGNEDNPTVQGNIAGARATAEVAPHVAQAVQSAQGEVAPHVAQAAGISNATFGNNAQLARIRAMSNPTAQVQLSRMSQAAGMAKDADASMRAFEQKILTGQKQITPEGMTAARTALKGGSLLPTAAELYLNQSDPELAEYIRNAKAMSTAERMIMPRGGSNYMSQAEQTLSGVGTGAGSNLIHQAQQYRSRITQSLDREGALGDAGISSTLPFPGSQRSNSGLGGFAGLPDKR